MHSKAKISNLIFFVTWVISCVVMAVLFFINSRIDFRGYYAAALVVMNGGNPYDYHVLAPELLRISGFMGNNPYFYAPWFAWFIIPFTFFPFEIARGIWMLLNLFLWTFGLYKLGSYFSGLFDGWKRWLLFILLTFQFAFMTWQYEQTGILLFALFVALLFSLKQKQWILAGIWMAALLIKPNITLIPVLTIVIWLCFKKNWRPVISMISLTSLLILISFLVTPGWLKPFFEPGFTLGLTYNIDGPGQIMYTRANTALKDWLMIFPISQSTSWIISIISLLIGLLFLYNLARNSNSLESILVASVLVTYAVTPYVVQYDFPVLAIAVIWILSRPQFFQRNWWLVVKIALGVFILSVVLWEPSLIHGYWMVIGLICLALVDRFNKKKPALHP